MIQIYYIIWYSISWFLKTQYKQDREKSFSFWIRHHDIKVFFWPIIQEGLEIIIFNTDTSEVEQRGSLVAL